MGSVIVEDGLLLAEGGILPTKTNDSTVFSWILDEANKIDTSAEVVITDYDIINDSASAEEFITRVKPLSEKFDVVGAVAHFGAEINKSSYQSKINYIAEKLGKPILLTDVDFSCDISEAPAKLEELMRSCFANPNVRGIVMGSWHQSYRRKADLTNYFVDSLNQETPVGQRWREIMEEWKSSAGGNADDSGKIRFSGFVGQYQVWISCFLDTFSVVPGEDTQKIEVVYHHVEPEKIISQQFFGSKKIEVKINGKSIKVSANYKTPLFISTYSLTGQRLSRLPLNLFQKGYRLTLPPTKCYIVRIETDKGLPLYGDKMVRLR